MRVVLFAVAAALVACGGKSKPVQLAPLPDDAKVAAAPPMEAPPTAAPAPEAPPPPPAPTGPVELKIPARDTTVKLIAKGKGKLAPLRYTGKVGGKQQVELALDFASNEAMGTEKREMAIPTIVLIGEAETKAIDKDGRADYAITITGSDARAVAGAQLRPEDMKQMLSSLTGLAIGGSVAANGAASEVTLRVEKPDRRTAGALDMVRMTFPALPFLPAEPVGVGAKWQTTTKTKLAGRIDVTLVTDYELVSLKGTTWSIKGTSTVTGGDQELEGGKISGIRGTGQSELALVAGALYPTYKTAIETQFTASDKDASMTLALRVGGAITAK
jgi:hypothetical protein